MDKEALKQIAQMRECTQKEAREFCKDVRESIDNRVPYVFIAQALQELDPLRASLQQTIKQAGASARSLGQRIRLREPRKQKRDYPIEEVAKLAMELQTLSKIAQVCGCESEEAEEICIHVQWLVGVDCSYECVAQAIEILASKRQSCTRLDVARLVTQELHGKPPSMKNYTQRLLDKIAAIREHPQADEFVAKVRERGGKQFGFGDWDIELIAVALLRRKIRGGDPSIQQIATEARRLCKKHRIPCESQRDNVNRWLIIFREDVSRKPGGAKHWTGQKWQ